MSHRRKLQILNSLSPAARALPYPVLLEVLTAVDAAYQDC